MRPNIFHVISLLCCLVLLTGCAPDFTGPENPVLAEPQLNETTFHSFDGTELPLRTWLPPEGLDAVRSIIIAVHGFNDYSNFIKKSAQYFSNHQIAVYAYDQRGFGNGPKTGKWSSGETMAMDLKTLISLIAEKHQELPIYLLGHSMGGAVVMQAMNGKQNPDVAGAILVAPAVWSRAFMPFYLKGVLWLAAHTFPWHTLTGESLDKKPSDNIEMLREQGRDPLVIKETRIDTIYGLQNLMDEAYAGADNYTLKTLVLYGHNDEIIPEEPVRDAFQRFPLQPDSEKDLILYKNGFHMLLRDLQAENVMRDIVAWVYED